MPMRRYLAVLGLSLLLGGIAAAQQVATADLTVAVTGLAEAGEGLKVSVVSDRVGSYEGVGITGPQGRAQVSDVPLGGVRIIVQDQAGQVLAMTPAQVAGEGQTVNVSP